MNRRCSVHQDRLDPGKPSPSLRPWSDTDGSDPSGRPREATAAVGDGGTIRLVEDWDSSQLAAAAASGRDAVGGIAEWIWSPSLRSLTAVPPLRSPQGSRSGRPQSVAITARRSPGKGEPTHNGSATEARALGLSSRDRRLKSENLADGHGGHR